MINDKTAKRIAFTVEYEGDNYDENPQLKFMIAKSVEPEEIRHKLKKARQVQQAIIMQTESNSKQYDSDIYVGLQPKVFRKINQTQQLENQNENSQQQSQQLNNSVKNSGYYNIRDQVDERKSIRLHLQQKLLEDKKNMTIDVSKGKSAVSYLNLFKPPKPITQLQQFQKQNQDQSKTLNYNKTLTAYEKRQLNIHGPQKIINSLEYAIKQQVNSELKKQAIQLIIKEARSKSGGALGILKPIPGLKEPQNYSEFKNQKKPYQYYMQKNNDESDHESEKSQDQQNLIKKNQIVKQYEPPQNSIVKIKIPQQKKKEEIFKDQVLKHNKIEYDENIEKIRKDIEQAKEQHTKSRNQGLDPGPMFPHVSRNLNRDQSSFIDNTQFMQKSYMHSPLKSSQLNPLQTTESFQLMSTQQNTNQGNTMNSTLFYNTNNKFSKQVTFSNSRNNSLDQTKSKLFTNSQSTINGDQTQNNINDASNLIAIDIQNQSNISPSKQKVSFNITKLNQTANNHSTSDFTSKQQQQDTLNSALNKTKLGLSMFKISQEVMQNSSSACQNYAQVKHSLPKIRLKSLQKTHDDYLIERQKRLELAGGNEYALQMTNDQKQFFINKAKGGNKNYRVAKHYDNDIMLINPTVDASDKEIFRRNGMSSAAEQLKQLVNTKERLMNQESAFLPTQFGQQSDPIPFVEKIIKNKIKQPSDPNDMDIIFKRQVESLYQKVGLKLLSSTNNITQLRMNIKLSEYFGKDVILQSLSKEEKEKRIKQYLYDRIKLQFDQNDKNQNQDQLGQIDEDQEEDYIDLSPRDNDYDLKEEELYMRQYQHLRQQFEKYHKYQNNKAYKDSLNRHVKLGMIQGKRFNSKKQAKSQYQQHASWSMINFEDKNRKEKMEVDSEDSDYQNQKQLLNSKEKPSFKQVKCLSQNDLEKIERDKLKRKEREIAKREKAKELRKKVFILEEQDQIAQILKERDAKERNLIQINKKMKDFERKQEQLNLDSDTPTEFDSNQEYEDEPEDENQLQNQQQEQSKNQQQLQQQENQLQYQNIQNKQQEQYTISISNVEQNINQNIQSSLLNSSKQDINNNLNLTSDFGRSKTEMPVVIQITNEISNTNNFRNQKSQFYSTFKKQNTLQQSILNHQSSQISSQNAYLVPVPINIKQSNNNKNNQDNISIIENKQNINSLTISSQDNHKQTQNSQLKSDQQQNLKISEISNSKQNQVKNSIISNNSNNKNKVKKLKLEKESEILDYKIHHENFVIQKVRSILDQNLKNRVGTGLNSNFQSLVESQEQERNSYNFVLGMQSQQYRKELANLKQQIHKLDDAFISRNGIKVKPERHMHKNKYEKQVKELTEFEMIDLRRQQFKDRHPFDLDREVLKHQMQQNREFFKNLDNPINDVEEDVNENIKFEMRKRKKELQKIKLFNKPLLVKKLPLIDEIKFNNMTVKSLAEKKRIWVGKKKGRYKAADLAKWFKVYEETKLYEIRNDIGKPDNQYEILG